MEAEIKQLSPKPPLINYLTKEAVNSDRSRSLHKTPQLYLKGFFYTAKPLHSVEFAFFKRTVQGSFTRRRRVSEGAKTEGILMRTLCARALEIN